jgi:hypothetical protein
MQAKLEEAFEADKPMRFALGCLAASLCRMPTHPDRPQSDIVSCAAQRSR